MSGDFRNRTADRSADQEHRLAHALAVVCECLHLALGQLREPGCHLDRRRGRPRRLQDERRRQSKAMLRDDPRAA